jgi:hypothetical protein
MPPVTEPNVEIPQEEVVRRVAILKRFRELLQAQRERFRNYLEVLDKQKDVIERGSPDDILSHVELEEKIVADIFSIQKVIDPLEDMYRVAYPERVGLGAGRDKALDGTEAGGKAQGPGEEPAFEVQNLKNALEDLKNEAIFRSERNRALLANRMSEIHSEIKSLKQNPYTEKRSVYGESGSPSFIDIQG